MAFRRQVPDPESKLDFGVEISATGGDLEALMSRLLERGKEFEASRKSFLRMARHPRNLPTRTHLVAKADEAKESKKRCDLILHSLMHKVQAPGLSAADWKLVDKALKAARAR